MHHEQMLAHLDTFRWYLFEKIPQCPFWFVWSPLVAYVDMLQAMYGVGYFRGVYLFKDDYFFMYKVEGALQDAGNALLEQDKREKDFLFSILDESDRLSDLLLTESKSIHSLDVETADCGVLADVFERTYQIHEQLWIQGQAINLLEHGYSLVGDYLQSLLIQDGVSQEQIAEVMHVLTMPDRFSYAQKEEQEILALAQGEYTSQDVERHHAAWAFLGYNWIGPAYDKMYFEDRLTLLRQDPSLQDLIHYEDDYRAHIQKQKSDIAENFKLSQETLRVAEIFQRIIFSKGLRVDASWMFYWSVERIFKKIAQNYSLSFKQVQFLKPSEIIALLRGFSVDVSLSNMRQKAYAVFFEEGKMTEYYGEHVMCMFEHLQKSIPTVDIDVKELRGEVGSLGIAQGRVCIVNVPEDIAKMSEGDVLVSHTTNPRLVPAMKMASAIVADIGGATSHAAIIARELKKPCIIGTKIATKVLKDGDLVEVNAEKGIVRILHKS